MQLNSIPAGFMDDGTCLLLLTSYDFMISLSPYYLELHSTMKSECGLHRSHVQTIINPKEDSHSMFSETQTETTRKHVKSKEFPSEGALETSAPERIAENSV